MSESTQVWDFEGVSSEDIAAIKAQVQADPACVEQRDEHGDTALMAAIAAGNVELVEFLLSSGADPNASVDDGYRCLHTAVEQDGEDSLAIVRLLVSADADINAFGIHGWTALHMAAARGLVEKARVLIEAGADVNRRLEIDASETPLMEAAANGQAETTQLLLDHGADPSMRETMQNRTPKQIAVDAAKGPDPSVADLLKEQNLEFDMDAMLDSMGLPSEQVEQLKRAAANVDLSQTYIDGARSVAEAGDYDRVIEILEAHE